MRAAVSLLLLAACAHDPAHDRPLEPLAPPHVAPTNETGAPAGGDGDSFTPAKPAEASDAGAS